MAKLSSLAQRLTHARLLAGLSRRKVCEKADIAQAIVGQIERGVTENPRSNTIIKIAEVLGVSADWLLTGEGEAPTAATAA